MIIFLSGTVINVFYYFLKSLPFYTNSIFNLAEKEIPCSKLRCAFHQISSPFQFLGYARLCTRVCNELPPPPSQSSLFKLRYPAMFSYFRRMVQGESHVCFSAFVFGMFPYFRGNTIVIYPANIFLFLSSYLSLIPRYLNSLFGGSLRHRCYRSPISVNFVRALGFSAQRRNCQNTVCRQLNNVCIRADCHSVLLKVHRFTKKARRNSFVLLVPKYQY